MSAHVDRTKARHPDIEAMRVDEDFPTRAAVGLDRPALKSGMNRQAQIKTSVAERLER